MSDDQHEQRQRSSLAVLLAAAALLPPFMYLFLLGPAVWLFRHGYMSDAIANVIVYMPLQFLHDYCQPIGDVLDWYLELWR